MNKDLEDPKPHVNRRNIPMHILFWTFVVFLLYLFYKAFAH